MNMTADPAIAADVAAVARIDAVPTILQAVAHTTGLRFVAVARVTDEQWTACAVHDHTDFGLEPGSALLLETTLCNEIRRSRQPLAISHASSDPDFADHPAPRLYGFESYISVPIICEGDRFFGTLCALDREPAKLDDPNLLTTLELFAQLIAMQLDAQEKSAWSDEELRAALEMARLRERFIAVLGHDLRNPLQAIDMAAELVQLESPEPAVARNVGHVRRSVRRMVDLIDHLLDFARGRMGGGIPIAARADYSLAAELEHVIQEARLVHPKRVIEASLAVDMPIECDAPRIGQLLDNLLANAMRHGVTDQPVHVDARCNGTVLELSVHNGGVTIPSDKLARLFQPFTRTLSDAPGPGLGLGLYIASEIAKSHRGTLIATSTETEGTRFVFTMKAAPAGAGGVTAV